MTNTDTQHLQALKSHHLMHCNAHISETDTVVYSVMK